MRGQLCTADGTWNAEVEQVVPGGVAWRAKRHPFDTNPWVLVIPPFWVHRHSATGRDLRNAGMTVAGLTQANMPSTGGIVDLTDAGRARFPLVDDEDDIDALDYEGVEA